MSAIPTSKKTSSRNGIKRHMSANFGKKSRNKFDGKPSMQMMTTDTSCQFTDKQLRSELNGVSFKDVAKMYN
jgi:hypothetical protein